MAIELHHLNTHGMMEQAGKVIDSVVRMKERIAELEKENQTLAEDVSEKIESITELMELVEKYKSEKAEHEEERRWRKFSEEKPEHDAWCLVFHEGEIDADHYTDDCNSQDRFVMYGFYVTHWMPLPSAPKEDNK